VSVDVLNLIFLGWFVVGLLLITVRISYRVWRFRRRKIPVPSLLWRDLATMASLAVPFAFILLFRAMGIIPQEQFGTWWIVSVGLVACVGITVFGYFEYFVIDNRVPVLLEETQDQREDREFGDKRRDLEIKHAETLAKSENDQPPQ
jgi:hypothetical protein